MGNRYLKQFIKAADSELVTIDGYVTIDGTTVASHTLPLVASVAYTATGQFTITLNDAWASMKSCVITLECLQPQALFLQIVSHDVSVAKTIVVRTINSSGVETDPTVQFGLNVSITLKNSTLATGR